MRRSWLILILLSLVGCKSKEYIVDWVDPTQYENGEQLYLSDITEYHISYFCGTTLMSRVTKEKPYRSILCPKGHAPHSLVMRVLASNGEVSEWSDEVNLNEFEVSE